MDSFFSSHNLHDNLLIKNINCFGTVRPNSEGVLRYFGKKLKMKQSDMKTRVRGDMLSIVWEDKRNANMLANMRNPPADGNFLRNMQMLRIQL
jgi:hypothetical protein